MKPEKAQKIFDKMKELIKAEMFENQNVSDDVIKAQIAKGWLDLKSEGIVLCLSCNARLGSKLDHVKKSSECIFCGNNLSF